MSPVGGLVGVWVGSWECVIQIRFRRFVFPAERSCLVIRSGVGGLVGAGSRANIIVFLCGHWPCFRFPGIIGGLVGGSSDGDITNGGTDCHCDRILLGYEHNRGLTKPFLQGRWHRKNNRPTTKPDNFHR